jgi:TetR/AcrR family transcriptional regulator
VIQRRASLGPVTTTGLRAQRRQRRLEFSREHLLDAAEAVFGARGFPDATIKEIAERAELSVGAVYGIVDGKDDLLAQTLARRGGELLQAMSAILAGDGAPRSLLHALADVQIEFFRRNPDFGRLWLRSSGPGHWGLSPASLERLGGDVDRAMDLQAELIRRGQAVGNVRAGDAQVLARIFSGMVQAFQASDPASVGDDGAERLSLADFHALVEGAFAP